MDIRFAKRTELMDSSVVRETLKLTAQPDIISFAGGMPAPEVFPVEAMRAASDKVLATAGPTALQYGPSDGCLPLREKIAARHRREGMACGPENILMINGSQQGLDLAGKLFLDPGDLVVCEDPTYTAALSTFRSYECGFLPIDTDDDGMILEDLERKLAANPRAKLIYVIPTFQNPTGRTWSMERRKAFMEVVNKHNLPVIEDNPYGELRYEGEMLPSLKSLDTKGLVMFLGTFSKIFCPGLRLGWVAAEHSLLTQFVKIKQSADLHTSNFDQGVADAYMETYDLDEHVKEIVALYKHRRDVILKAMEEKFPAGTEWTHPEGGLFLWLTFPEGVSARKVFDKCIEMKVAGVIGDAFYPNQKTDRSMRINFSNMPDDRIVEGIERMAKAIKECM